MGLAAALLIFLPACVDRDAVFTEPGSSTQLPVAAAGFLGYLDVGERLPVCGSCHPDKFPGWKQTGHALAWADLQASGQAQASCTACHTVNERGNGAREQGGFSRIAAPHYRDVQCESCHGPGANHVQNPAVVTPLAAVGVGVELSSGCGGCHRGAHAPFVEQWTLSAHARGPGGAGFAATNASCMPCHEGKTALRVKFGVTANYLERDSAGPQRITCVVCHDPHGSPYEKQLRASLSQPTLENLCVTCHSRTGDPPWSAASATSPARGPHGAQGLLVIGQNVGWIPPGFPYDTSGIVSSHGTSANPRLCGTCHVPRKTVTDPATGGYQIRTAGHLFEAIPCVDATGVPTGNRSCAPGSRDFGACATSGCHLTSQAALSAYTALNARFSRLLGQLWVDGNANGIIDATDGGLLAQMVARQTAADSAALDFGSTTMTVAKGALWNAALAANDERAYFRAGRVFGRSWSAHPSAGNGVHNPFLLEVLLVTSITEVKKTYALAGPAPDLEVRATPPPGIAGR